MTYLRSLLLPVLLLLLAAVPVGVDAHSGTTSTAILQQIGVDQKLNNQLPLDLTFRDESGRTVRLGEYFNGKPVILTLNYYNCPNLCPLVLDGLVNSLQDVSFNIGKDFQVVTVSVDPTETPAIASKAKSLFVGRYGRPGAATGWHFLTGTEANIKQLASAAGIRYAYDADQKQYAHPGVVTVATAAGRVSRYYYGISYSPRDLRLGLVEATEGKIGSPIDKAILFCFHYDPSTGKYTPLIQNLVRAGGLATVAALGMVIVLLKRKEARPDETTGGVS